MLTKSDCRRSSSACSRSARPTSFLSAGSSYDVCWTRYWAVSTRNTLPASYFLTTSAQRAVCGLVKAPRKDFSSMPASLSIASTLAHSK